MRTYLSYLFSIASSFLDFVTISPEGRPVAPLAIKYDTIKVSFSPMMYMCMYMCYVFACA